MSGSGAPQDLGTSGYTSLKIQDSLEKQESGDLVYCFSFPENPDPCLWNIAELSESHKYLLLLVYQSSGQQPQLGGTLAQGKALNSRCAACCCVQFS